MSSDHHTNNIFTEKKKPKRPIKFKVTLNPEQKEAKKEILNQTITLLAGKAGSGKTMLACQIALDLLFTKQINKIIITRPTVSKEDIGFLPGDLRDKMDPWVQPIYQNMFLLYDRSKIEKLIEENVIEIVPLSFMRGRTMLDSVIIVDEAQNVTTEQMEMIATRIGLRSKMIICGDEGQIDLKYKKDSSFKFLYTKAKKIQDMGSITLYENHRHPVVDSIIDLYSEVKENNPPSKRRRS